MKIKEYLTSTKEKRNAELEELKARLAELEAKNAESEDEEELKATGEELDALKAKKEELEAELAEIDAQIAELDQPKDGEVGQRKFITMKKTEERKMNMEEREERAKKFMAGGTMKIGGEEVRAMLVSSGKIATPTEVKGINELPNEVSSIIDMVLVEDCEGMGSNKIAYEFTAPKGGITVEGEAYAEGDTVTDFVTTTPQTVTTISYISKQVRKQSPLKFEEKVKKNALIALRKKMSEIVVTKMKGSDLCVSMTLDKVDEKTVRKISLGYGGDENVEGNAIMLLNKNTLTTLGDVRGTNEKKAVLEITPNASNPNIGIIKDGGLSCQYVLNSNMADNEFIYGQPKKFELDLFSDYEVKVSEDFKIDKGLLTIVGDVEADGAVVFKDGFVYAKVGA